MDKHPHECSLDELKTILSGRSRGVDLLEFTKELLGAGYVVSLGDPGQKYSRYGGSMLYVGKRSVPGVYKAHPWPINSSHDFTNWLLSCTYPDPVELLDALRVLEALSVEPAPTVRTFRVAPGAGGGSGAVLGGRGGASAPPKIKP